MKLELRSPKFLEVLLRSTAALHIFMFSVSYTYWTLKDTFDACQKHICTPKKKILGFVTVEYGQFIIVPIQVLPSLRMTCNEYKQTVN